MAYKKTLFALCFVLGILLLVKEIYAQMCFVDPPRGPAAIYEDSLLPGWTIYGSWNSTINERSTPGGQDGSYALQGVFNADWAGVELHQNNTSTVFLDSLVFRIKRADMNGTLYVTAHKTGGSLGTWAALSIPESGTWYSMKVSLTDMGLSPGESIQGVIFQASVPTTAYFDNVAIVTALLQFPLSGYTPYSAKISAILDHSVPTGYNGINANGVIKAYDGFSINSSNYVCGNPSCSIKGYKQDSSGTPFDPPKMSLLSDYDDLDNNQPSKRNILWYDGHSGYDYPRPLDTPMYAATAGILCVTTTRDSPNGTDLWRKDSYCPYATDPINGPSGGDAWNTWHTFYIVYPNEYGGITYSMWYLHANDLHPSVKSSILNNGYADVTQGTFVAYVGYWGLESGPHLHFEVRQNGTKIIDPYGDGSPGNFLVLWQDRPQL